MDICEMIRLSCGVKAVIAFYNIFIILIIISDFTIIIMRFKRKWPDKYAHFEMFIVGMLVPMFIVALVFEYHWMLFVIVILYALTFICTKFIKKET